MRFFPLQLLNEKIEEKETTKPDSENPTTNTAARDCSGRSCIYTKNISKTLILKKVIFLVKNDYYLVTNATSFVKTGHADAT